MELREIRPEAYAREVLPQTAELWAGRRDLDSYVRQILEIARSGFGRRTYSTVGLYDSGRLVASCKRYERTFVVGDRRLKGVGFGAVFTPKEVRGRGYASAMLAMLLDQSREASDDLAYLFSDIRPQFYAELGFIECTSRAFSLRADSLGARRLVVDSLNQRDWPAVARCFEACERAAPWRMLRTPLIWTYVQMRMRHRAEHPATAPTNLLVRRGRGIAAYVLGSRDAEHDAYVLDEFAFTDASAAESIAPLLRAAAGDLRRAAGWLPPAHARRRLPRYSSRRRKDAIFMIAPLRPTARRLIELAAAPTTGDGIWSSDHI